MQALSVPDSAARKPRPAELLDAALDTFRERGFAGTRMEDIAARAGVSKGTIYLYFPSKEAIFEALVMTPQMAMTAETGPATARLGMLVKAFARVTADARLVALPRLVLAEAGNFPEMARFYREQVVGRGLALVAGILEQGMDAGEFRRLDPMITARVFLAPLVLSTLWRATFAAVEDAPLPTETVLGLHLELFLRGIAAEGAS